MTLPDKDTLGTYGGALNDYSPVIDATTDRPAAGANQQYASTAMMSRTAMRVWCRFTWNGTTLTLVNHEECWGGAIGNAVPTLTHTGTGVATITYPVTVADEIPLASPGGVASRTVNLRAGWSNVQGGTNWGKVTVTSANVLTLTLSSVADPAGVDYDVFAI